MKGLLRFFICVFAVTFSPLTSSHALDWPVVTFAEINNKNPAIGDVVVWKVAIDCRGSALRDVDLSYTDPTGVIQVISLGNFLLKSPRPQVGTFDLSLKITNQAVSGVYKVFGVGVWCVGDPNYPGRYARGALQGDLSHLNFTVVNSNPVVCIPSKLESLRLVSDSSVSAGDRIIIEAVVKLNGVINENLLILEGPSGLTADQEDDLEESSVLPREDLQNPGDLNLRWVFLVSNKWAKGTYKISHLSFAGLEGFKRDRVDVNSYPYFSTDKKCGVRYSSNSGDQLNLDFAPMEPKLVESFSFNVVELSVAAKNRKEVEEKQKIEALGKSQILPQLKNETIAEAIIRNSGQAGDLLLFSIGCVRDLDTLDSNRGALAELQQQASQTWKKVLTEVKWARVANCQGNSGMDFGILWTVISNTNPSGYRVKISYADQEFFVNMVSPTSSSHSREIFESIGKNSLDLSGIESALIRQRAAESSIQSGINAKNETEAKVAAELKSKQEAEAKASAAANKKTTITCVKGKLTKKVTAIKPKCPMGYKLKK